MCSSVVSGTDDLKILMYACQLFRLTSEGTGLLSLKKNLILQLEDQHQTSAKKVFIENDHKKLPALLFSSSFSSLTELNLKLKFELAKEMEHIIHTHMYFVIIFELILTNKSCNDN